ncbi:MAG: hypothetical protein AB7Q37_08020 [Pyrinomonadaceae bacterium]
MALNIWLLNPYKIRYPWEELRLLVTNLMQPVVALRDKNYRPAGREKFVSVNVQNRYSRPGLGPHDLACYVLPVKNFGFGGVDFGKTDEGRPESAGLTTHADKVVCSEVYLGEEIVESETAFLLKVDKMTNPEKGVWVKERWNPQYVSRLIYHELMHNVTPKWSEKKLHVQPGVSVGKESPERNASQSKDDIRILAKHMDTAENSQWLGGFDIV